MLLHLKEILSPDEVRQARKILANAPWGDGKVTSGQQSALVKNNSQLPEHCAESKQLQKLVLDGLTRDPLFFSAALPKRISPPLFNHYGGAANSFCDHVDTSVRYLHNGERVRTDTYREECIKLAAGDMILYPGNRVHRVTPVTFGHRFAAFFWIESMVRSEEQRRLLFEMDKSLISLRHRVGETDPAVVGLTSTYHNLLRLWTDT